MFDSSCSLSLYLLASNSSVTKVQKEAFIANVGGFARGWSTDIVYSNLKKKLGLGLGL